MKNAPRVGTRLDLPSGGRGGPGKIALLEAIGEAGSIAGAARRSACPILAPGGWWGATLTAAGRVLVAHYRAMEEAARKYEADPQAQAALAFLAGPSAAATWQRFGCSLRAP